MARKSKVSQEAANEDGDVIKAAIREIEKKYGKGTVIDLKGGALDVEGIHSGSLALDAALGGKGLPKGRLIELFGGESSSKTTLALKCVADFQKQGGSVAYIDAEHAIDPEWAEDKLGVNMAQERFFFFQPGTAEESLDIVQMSIETLGCKLVVVDSVAALVPKAELEGDMGQAHVGLLARQMGQACRKLKKLVADTGAIVIFINQVRCIAKNELVIGPNGIEPAGDIQPGASMVNGIGEQDTVSEIIESFQRSRMIRLKDGRTLTCGMKHPVMVMSSNGDTEWRAAEDLSVGDYVGSPLDFLPEVSPARIPEIEPHNNALPCPMPTHCDERICRFLGMWYSDGSMIESDKSVRFTENSSERRESLVAIASDLGWPVRVLGATVRFTSPVYMMLEYFGCTRGAKNKSIPHCITGKMQWKSFLNGFFDTHFSVKQSPNLNISVRNQASRKKIQIALLGLGIQSSEYVRKDENGILTISGRDIDRYLDVIGFSEPSKQETALKIYGQHSDGARGKMDVIPHPEKFIMAARETDGWKNLSKKAKSRVASVLCQGLCLSRKDYCDIRDKCGISGHADDFVWMPVSRVCDGPEMEMVDFEVSSHHTFIAGGMTTHNCNVGAMGFGDPTTTPGGRALKFFSSIRIKTARIQTLKDSSGDPSGIVVKAKVIKNKIAPPFKEATFEVHGDCGISRELELIDAGLAAKVITRSGSWHDFEGTKLGSSRLNARIFLEDNPDVAKQIEERIFNGAENANSGESEAASGDGDA